MPFYNDLRPDADFAKRDFVRVFPHMTRPAKIRTIDGLLRLREALDKAIPSRRTEQNLLAASWNIKEFGHTTQRLPESYYYIAEIVARFDLVAIQEVKSTLKDIGILMRILGSDWSYLVNDITDGSSGNRERSCYLYNNKRLNLSGLVGELVLWPAVSDGAMISQLAHTPYMTGFRAGWKSFVLINLHLSPDKTGNKAAARKVEVDVEAVWNRMLPTFKHEIEGHNIRITAEFHSPPRIFGVEAFVYSVFYNVVSNAIKYADVRKSSWLKLTTREDGEFLQIVFEDNGIGFNSSQYTDKLFKPFTRFNSIKEGRGLGLYLMKIQMEMMGGEIRLVSHLDEGTWISLRFKKANH